MRPEQPLCWAGLLLFRVSRASAIDAWIWLHRLRPQNIDRPRPPRHARLSLLFDKVLSWICQEGVVTVWPFDGRTNQRWRDAHRSILSILFVDDQLAIVKPCGRNL